MRSMPAFSVRTAARILFFPFCLPIGRDSTPSGTRASAANANVHSQKIAQHPPAGQAGALYQYDVLVMIFDLLNLEDKADRATCACSARVCRAWAEPASRVLWGGTKWTLSELCDVLRRCVGPGEPRIGPGIIVRRNKVQQLSVIRCGARVRQLAVAPRVLKPSPPDIETLCLMLSMSGGQTFLPALLSLSWAESPSTHGLLLRLVPPSLQDLELILHPDVKPEQLHRLFVDLPPLVPSLRRVRIYVLKQRPALYPPIDSLLGLTSVRELALEGDITVCPEQLCTLFAGLTLTSLAATIRDLDDPAWNGTLDGVSLKTLRLAGTCTELTALLTRLHAPNLTTAALDLAILDANFDQAAHLLLSRSLLNFAPALHALHLHYRQMFAFSSAAAAATAHNSLISDAFEPLFGRLEHLETFALTSRVCARLTDDQVLRLAQGWPTLRALALTNHPCEPEAIPTPAALLHLARHCPNLRTLRIQFHARDFVPPPVDARQVQLRHPLRGLQQTNEACGCWNLVPLAEFLDDLFPYVKVVVAEELSPVYVFSQCGFDWQLVGLLVSFIRYARKQHARKGPCEDSGR